MNNGWTPERRRRQAYLIKQWQPWKKSTGPKTVEGKQRASKNAVKLCKFQKLLHHELKKLKYLLNKIKY